MANKAFAGMAQVTPQESRAPRLVCGFHVVEITSCRIFATRKKGDAVIVELRVIGSSGHSEHLSEDGPTPAHIEGSEASLYIQISGREPQIYQREVKSFILAAMGVDTRDEDGRAKLAAWDAADAWTRPIGKSPCLTEQCLPDDGGRSALVGRTMAVWGRPKESGGKYYTNHFYEVWDDVREERDGLPVFDAARPPEMAPRTAPF